MNELISSDEPAATNYARYYVIAGIGITLTIIAFFLFGGGGPTPPPPEKQRPDDPLRTAREALSKAGDLTTCREAITQVNLMLNRPLAGDAARPDIPPAADWLRQRFDLHDDEWAEINSESFTLLDGHHLETAFLFRDAALSFTRDGVLDNAPPLRRAELAFDWAVRQVRLPEGRDSEADPLPLNFVLRRGRGSAAERALVFLALLEQLDLPGCLITLREQLAAGLPLWACGVLIGRDIYLFDPRMGTPLPGPGGVGIATLAEAQNKPELLKQLEADGYDVTAEQARKAHVYVAPPLSALAPRMRYLEKLLQDQEVAAPVISVRLGVDATGLFKQWEDAQAQSGIKDPPAIQAWPAAARAARSILPIEEGGIDKGQRPRWNMLRLSIVPMQHVPPIINRDMGFMYERMMEKFGGPFLSLSFEPNQPRDLLLRGHFNEASRILTTMRTETTTNAARLQGNPDMPRLAADSVKRIQEAQGRIFRAQNQGEANIEELQSNLAIAVREGQGWVDAYIDGCAAVPLGQEVSYQLALTKHEQAIRMQLLVDFPARRGAPNDTETEEARNAWLNASEWWTTFLSKYADASAAPPARLQAARARMMLGERDAALDLLREHAKLTDLEKVGRIIVARQLEKK